MHKGTKYRQGRLHFKNRTAQREPMSLAMRLGVGRGGFLIWENIQCQVYWESTKESRGNRGNKGRKKVK